MVPFIFIYFSLEFNGIHHSCGEKSIVTLFAINNFVNNFRILSYICLGKYDLYPLTEPEFQYGGAQKKFLEKLFQVDVNQFLASL